MDIPFTAIVGAVAALSGAIAYMFKVVVNHHTSAINDLREERAQLIAQLAIKDKIVERHTKTIAQLVMTMFFLPKEFKTTAAETIQEIEREEGR